MPTLSASLDDALKLAGDAEQIFVIGGAQLYASAMPRARRVLLTEIDADFDGDTRMPALDRTNGARPAGRRTPDERATFCVFVRRLRALVDFACPKVRRLSFCGKKSLLLRAAESSA